MNTPQTERRYPVGMQTFAEVRKWNCVYVDKTDYIYKITHSSSRYYFLSRPRRFGKSLLIDTLRSYFEGRKELFEGLKIAECETEWTEYPVLHFDMSTAKHHNKDKLTSELERKLFQYEKIYGREESDISTNQRLQGIIERAYAKTGRQVVVLIDEYDAPLLDVVHEDTSLPELRQVMRNFYSPLKACDRYIRFVFITGITKFSQLSAFSKFNNLKNISMLNEFAGICGITDEELRTTMWPDVELLAQHFKIEPTKMYGRLKEYYDGYHFSPSSPDIFNPFSLLMAMDCKTLDAHWFASGTPTYIIEMLRKYGVAPQNIGGLECLASDFDKSIENMTDVAPLLYQSGYITIKSYDTELGFYYLDIPNKEVRIGLMRSLLPHYVQRESSVSPLIIRMSRSIANGNIDEALEWMKTMLGTLPYCNDIDHEGHWQQMLYLVFTLLGYHAEVEVHTSTGRIDLSLCTKQNIYIMELKINGSAAEALAQINEKRYADRYALRNLPITKVGINFSTSDRTITDWIIEQ